MYVYLVRKIILWDLYYPFNHGIYRFDFSKLVFSWNGTYIVVYQLFCSMRNHHSLIFLVTIHTRISIKESFSLRKILHFFSKELPYLPPKQGLLDPFRDIHLTTKRKNNKDHGLLAHHTMNEDIRVCMTNE